MVSTAVSRGRVSRWTWARRSPPWSAASSVTARSSGVTPAGRCPAAWRDRSPSPMAADHRAKPTAMRAGLPPRLARPGPGLRAEARGRRRAHPRTRPGPDRGRRQRRGHRPRQAAMPSMQQARSSGRPCAPWAVSRWSSRPAEQGQRLPRQVPHARARADRPIRRPGQPRPRRKARPRLIHPRPGNPCTIPREAGRLAQHQRIGVLRRLRARQQPAYKPAGQISSAFGTLQGRRPDQR
jgi:hypothetical protein